jgi:peptide/nickel transport system permease protein
MYYASLQTQDIYVSGGLLLVYSMLLIAGNLLADIWLATADPRIRLS